MKKVYQSSAIKVLAASVMLLSTVNVYADEPKVAESDKPVVEQIVNTLTTLSGGSHKGFRANHAKGIVVLGEFTPAKSAASITKAAHFQNVVSPVTVRFQTQQVCQISQTPMVMLSQKVLRFVLHWQMGLSPTL